jgi:hypothetical protein
MISWIVNLKDQLRFKRFDCDCLVFHIITLELPFFYIIKLIEPIKLN